MLDSIKYHLSLFNKNIGFIHHSLQNLERNFKKMLGRNTAYFHHPRPNSSSSAIDVDGGGVEILLHHHQYLHHHHPEPTFPGLYLASNAAAPPPLESPAFFNQENGELPSMAAKKPAKTKKDRHSKIHTAQGPRDRRVRLSIGIARKFFDLQETLGFDKPSKTLDWLLTKSKTAIKELVQKKQSSSSPPSACELHGDDVGNGGESKRKLNGDKAATASNLAKESRAKARARARERTLEKMCFKQLGSDLNPSFQCRNSQLEFLQLSATTNNINNVPIYHDSLRNEDLIQESSAVIKRKNKNPSSSSSSSIMGFHQNHLVFSTDLNSNYINIPSANENWDFFGLNSQSNLHAAFDQHKFFNSNSNI